MSLPPEIQDLGEAEFVRACIIAPSGFGKTVFLGTALRGLFLTTDPEGTVSAKRFGSTCKEWPIRTHKDFEKAYVYLRDGGYRDFDVVLIDNITEVQKRALLAAKEAALMRPNSKADALVPEPGDYLRAQLALTKDVLQFHDLPMHVIWSSHQKGFEDGEGEPYYSAVIQGGKGELAQTILGYMNMIGFGEVIEKDGQEVRRLWFSYHGPYRGKDRSGSMGRFKDNLTVPDLIARFEAAKTTRRTPPATAKSSTSSKTKSNPTARPKRRAAL